MPKPREDNPKVTALSEQLAAARVQIAEAAERERKFIVDSKVEAIKLPAARAHFRALYDLALSEGAPKTVAFSEKGTTQERTPTEVLDGLASYINKNVSKLFVELARSGDTSRDGAPLDDPGAE